jgi:hypothetical protein
VDETVEGHLGDAVVVHESRRNHQQVKNLKKA